MFVKIIILILNLVFIKSFELEINDKCTIKESGEDGICLLDKDCEFMFKSYRMNNGPKPQICGFYGLSSIVCCPNSYPRSSRLFEAPIDKPETPECIVQNTGENGVFKMLEHCNTLTRQERSAKTRNKVCEDPICSDLICCPIRHLHKKKQKCLLYDDPEYVITSRLKLQGPCHIHESKTPGIYSEIKNCPKALKIIEDGGTVHKACKFDYCSNWTCCAIDSTVCNLEQVYLNEYSLIVGDNCFDKSSGLPGVCTHINFCPYLFQQSRLQSLTTCGFDCCSDVICCPHPNLAILGISDLQCAGNKRFVFENAKSMKPLISAQNESCRFGGEEGVADSGSTASPKEFPHMAALGFQQNNTIVWNNGGTLISDRYVITASHCVYTNESGFVQQVRLGVLDLTINPLVKDCPEDFKVTEIIQHPDYNSVTFYNDIALLFLDRRVDFNPFIRPACLPSSASIPPYLTILGWELDGCQPPKREVLIKANVELLSDQECNDHYKENIHPLTESQICAGTRFGDRNTCPGDSDGSPLFDYHPDYYKMFILYGITSFGKPCGLTGSASVYTKIFPYKKWIENIIWN